MCSTLGVLDNNAVHKSTYFTYLLMHVVKTKGLICWSKEVSAKNSFMGYWQWPLSRRIWINQSTPWFSSSYYETEPSETTSANVHGLESFLPPNRSVYSTSLDFWGICERFVEALCGVVWWEASPPDLTAGLGPLWSIINSPRRVPVKNNFGVFWPWNTAAGASIQLIFREVYNSSISQSTASDYVKDKQTDRQTTL